jgi:hypothetical protein
MLASLINHGSTSAQCIASTAGHGETSYPTCPNARIEWNDRMIKNPEWRSMPPEQWLDTEAHVGLAISYVAIRDIRPGEEVLIDYGPEWVAAWNRHIEAWRPPSGSSRYVSSYEMNDNPTVVIRTEAEGSYSTSQVELDCFDWYRRATGHLTDDEEAAKHPCRAKLRTMRDGEYRYVVELYRRNQGVAETEDDDAEDSEDDEVDEYEGDEAGADAHICTETLFEVLFDAPRDVFWFTDAHYSRDAMQPWSFRHPIGIPDDVMPRVWLSS